MKSKKKEKQLYKELDGIRILKNESIDLRELETKMVDLIQRATAFYQDQLDDCLSPFYYEYGSILVQILESQEVSAENSLNCVEISKNDRELRTTQLAYENLETARTIIRKKLDKHNIEMYKLQEQLTQVRQNIRDVELDMSRVLIRLGDLQTWREEFKDGIIHFAAALELIENTQNYNELSAAHYKFGNAILMQNENGCEIIALQHFEKAFRYTYNTFYQKECTFDLSENNLSQIQIDNQLLQMLINKMEDTYSQLKECTACQKEIEKWKNNEPVLVKKVEYLGKVNKNSVQINGIPIKRTI